MWSEVSASVRRAVATGRASRDVGQATLDRVFAARIRRRSGDEMYRRAIDLAGELGWSKSYDAEYLALAQIERVPVVTLDARLRTAAERLVGVIDVRDILR
jgi:predicted nucleic acid-binding protein